MSEGGKKVPCLPPDEHFEQREEGNPSWPPEAWPMATPQWVSKSGRFFSTYDGAVGLEEFEFETG